MSALNRDEFFNRLKERIGEDTSDEAIKFMEDVGDTYDELEGRAKNDWEEKYKELNEEWKEKYKKRFFNGPEVDRENGFDNDGEEHETSKEEAMKKQHENIHADGEPRTFEELFKEREG